MQSRVCVTVERPSSIRQSIQLSIRVLNATAAGVQVCCCAPGRQEISIDRGGCWALQQHGVQQQMRAVSCCQLMQEVEKRLVSVGGMTLNQ